MAKKARQRLDSSTTPLSLGAFDLGALLAPVTPEEFHGRIFEIDALHVARPRPRSLRPGFSRCYPRG
jgi:hypothetical protein